MHEPDDLLKVEVLAGSLSRDGWQGAPIVVIGDCAITGAHRLEAANRVVNSGHADLKIPVIELNEVFAEASLELAEHLDIEHQAAFVFSSSTAEGELAEGRKRLEAEIAVVEALDVLPWTIRSKYGIEPVP